MNHDNYDNNILKALQSIATSLRNIDKKLNTPTGIKQDELKIYLDRINNGGDTYLSDIKEVEE